MQAVTSDQTLTSRFDPMISTGLCGRPDFTRSPCQTSGFVLGVGWRCPAAYGGIAWKSSSRSKTLWAPVAMK
eukprot:562821-Amphidinium_carterae.2